MIFISSVEIELNISETDFNPSLVRAMESEKIESFRTKSEAIRYARKHGLADNVVRIIRRFETLWIAAKFSQDSNSERLECPATEGILSFKRQTVP